jgi:hypothetical protein
MIFDDIQWIRENKDTPLKTRTSNSGEAEEFQYADSDGLLSIDGKICLAVDAVQKSLEDSAEIELQDSTGSVIGVLCLTAGYELDLSSISDHFYIAYMTEVARDLYGSPYRMQKSYLILASDKRHDYEARYMKGSPLWGGFIHSAPPGSLIGTYRVSPTSILAIDNLQLPTVFHEESSIRSVVQPFASERFLKLYHLLELRFDYDIVERIKGLGDDLKGIGQIFSDYGRDELKRLRSVIEPAITDVEDLAKHLNSVKHCTECEDIAKNIFFRYGKDTNPLKEDNEAKYDLIMAEGGFSQERVRASRLLGGEGAVFQANYRMLIINIATYWIYRVRSSIAHSRIGEYVMSTTDEEFLVEIAEPLLRSVLAQVFRV